MGKLERSIGHSEVSFCLFGVCGPLRDFRKLHSRDWASSLCELASERGFGQVPELCWVRSQRTRWVTVVLAKLIDSDLAHACACKLCVQDSTRNNGIYQHFSDSCPSSPCTQARQFSFSWYVPGTFLAAVPSLELRKSVCEEVSLYTCLLRKCLCLR